MHFSAFIVVVIIVFSHIGKYGMLPTLLCSLLTAVTRTSQQLENMYLACATCENGVKHLMLLGNDQIIYGLAETGNPLNPHLTVCKLLNDLIMLGIYVRTVKLSLASKGSFHYGLVMMWPSGSQLVEKAMKSLYGVGGAPCIQYRCGYQCLRHREYHCHR